ncbi:MAG: DNA polymerase III subunit gamma/tau [Firmicutes bacterium]|nr:DNA polymerase III subunit gamma/tau [Bacillota bacterium]
MYSTLYRKYRPKTFDGIIGQGHITATLKNQIARGRIGHAYLFCGSRGVGKTSLARIFARAISCTGANTPCGKCQPCQKNEGETNLDIIEIDAASNNGVDDARDLREKVKYPPINGRYKVYIIDEVHMLTGAAFNALLKTLEEPPATAVFILATTEPHKLPATILSRCMRFDFRLVGMGELFALLANIFQSEGKSFEDEAVRAIAAAAEGSARDALSLADVCINLSSGVLTAADVMTAIGGGSELSEALFDAIADGDIPLALELTDRLYGAGKSMNVVAKELAAYARDLMLAKAAPKILKGTKERIAALIRAAERRSISGLAAIVQLFSEMDGELRYSVNPRIAMEAACVRAAGLYNTDFNAFDARLLRLELALEGGDFAANIAKKKLMAAENKNDTPPPPNPQSLTPALTPLSTFHSPLSPTLGSPPDDDFTDIPPEFLMQEAPPPENTSQRPPPDFPPIGAAQAQKLTAQQLWGRVITYFRKNGTPAFLQAVGKQNPFKVKLHGDFLTIIASREDYLLMCDDAFLVILTAALAAEGLDLRVAVEKDSGDVDMEKAVTKLYDQFGRRMVSVVDDK